MIFEAIFGWRFRLSIDRSSTTRDLVFSSIKGSSNDGSLEVANGDRFSQPVQAKKYRRTDVLVSRALSGARKFRYFELVVFNCAKSFSKDVFYFEHIVRDYSGFWLRQTVGTLYAVGFLLLLIPTATTSYNLFLRWIGA
ncbi:hypothetical protein NDL68_17550 [Neorhizobium galegae]|nr:hypothetical protein [Neorhizobium galegae]